MESRKIYRKPNYGNISKVTIKVMSDFEATFFSGKKKTGLDLDFIELVFLLKSDDFQEKIANQELFKEYFQYVFKNSLEKIKREKISVEKETLTQYETLIEKTVVHYFDYRYYDCIDEGTGEVITILI